MRRLWNQLLNGMGVGQKLTMEEIITKNNPPQALQGMTAHSAAVAVPAMKSMPASASPRSDEEPLFLQAARKRAQQEGVDIADVLAGDLIAIEQSHYPTKDCLTEEEVMSFSIGDEFPDDRLDHASQCPYCSTLLKATAPTGEGFADVLSRLEGRAQRKAYEEQAKVRAIYEELVLKRPQPTVPPIDIIDTLSDIVNPVREHVSVQGLSTGEGDVTNVATVTQSRTEVFSINEDLSVLEAAQYLRNRQVRSAGVLDSAGRLVGILSQSDLAEKVTAENKCPAWMSVKEIMNTDFVTVAPEVSLDYCLNLMQQHSIYHLPVVDQRQKFYGMFSITDFLHLIASKGIINRGIKSALEEARRCI